MDIAAWMRSAYKPERFRNEPGFHHNREERLIADREKDLRENGFALISHHDSVTGKVEFFGKLPDWITEPLLPAPMNVLQRLIPLNNRHLPNNYSACARRFRRPYYRVSDAEYTAIERLAGKAEVLLLDGVVQVTWGNADGGKALIPLGEPL